MSADTPAPDDVETRTFAAELIRDHLAETTDLNYGDRNRVAWGLLDSLLASDLLARRDAAVAAKARAEALAPIRALADQWEVEAADDERWLNGPRVSVSEAQQYPATIAQARTHADVLRAALAAAEGTET